jgi:antirestriction protein
MQTTTLDLSADIIDTRDIIARLEELEATADEFAGCANDVEHSQLTALLEALQGLGGDEQWRGNWYPVTLIRDSHFRDYAEELADECGLIPKDAKWPLNCIDWEQAARELRYDYSGVNIDGVTYWTR